MVETIYTLSNSYVVYSNSNGGYIEFDLALELLAEDNREIECIVVSRGLAVYNQVGRTEPYTIKITVRELTEEACDILAEAADTFDTSGILTITQTNKNSEITKDTTYLSAVPAKNLNTNFHLAERIKDKTIEILFQALRPEVRRG